MKVSALFFTFILMAAMMATALLTRPLMPIDETRYLTVAWEYMTRGEWILPTLNFEPYSHKPPFLFWMIDALWTITGDTGLWAARAASLMAAFATLFFTYRTARALYPQDKDTADFSLYLMMAMPFFLIYSTLIMFDTLLTAAVMLGIYAMVKVYTAQKKRYVLLLVLSFGLGGLIKGPVILLHLLPVLILFPMFQRPFGMSRRFWFTSALGGILGGAAITLAWALPAAHLGGPDYERMIFWGQSAGRMVSSFDHARPFWFYLVLLPVLLFPWLTALPLYREGIPEGPATLPTGASWQTRFLLCWAVPVLLAFMAISGKQVHYLFPLLPMAAIGAAHWIQARGVLHTVRPWTLYLWAVLPLGLGLMALMGFEFYVDLVNTTWASSLAVQIRTMNFMPMGWSFGIVLGLGIWLARRGSPARPVRTLRVIGVAMAVMIAGLHGGIAPLLHTYYDLSPIAAALERVQAEGRPIAMTTKWEGELGYLARLTKPVRVIGEGDVAAWLRQNPRGVVIYRSKKGNIPQIKGANVLFSQPYRSAERVMSLVEGK